MPPAPSSPSAQDRILGTLVVIVLRAKNLPNRVRIGKQNPYATISYGLHKKRTETIPRGGQQPEWDAEFRFEILREGLGGEEQSKAEGAVVNAAGGVGPALPAKEGQALAPQTTVYGSGNRVLRIACWADDAREPKLIGEGELNIEETIRKGKFDDWVKLDRKHRYAGEIYLELTWYSNDPRPARSSRREASQDSPSRTTAAGAYGGAGARVEREEGSSSSSRSEGGESGTEEWDGGSQVGLSVPGSTTAPSVDLGADYPDPDLAPLNRSMSAMALSRPPLPQPPTSVPPSSSAHHLQRLSASSSQQFPPGTESSYPPAVDGYEEQARRASYPYAPQNGSYTPAPPLQQAYNYPPPPPQAGEFGAYHSPPPPAGLAPSRSMGEFEQLAHQHYASQSQGYQQNGTVGSGSRPLPQPGYSTPAPPPPPSSVGHYDSYPSSASHYTAPPAAQAPYPPQPPLPPLPPIPPSGSVYWSQPPPPPPPATIIPPSASHASLSGVGRGMPHSDSQTTIYAAPLPQPPQPPAPPSAFSPAPPPPSISNSFSSYASSSVGAYESGTPLPVPPQPPQLPVFSPPPLPPSSDVGYAPAPYYGSGPPSLQQSYDPSPPPSASSYHSSHSSYAPPAPPPSDMSYALPSTSPYGAQAGRPPLPPPPRHPSQAPTRPLPGMFDGPPPPPSAQGY
ncbi:hypothetical protein JCM10213_001712 [Rhodosporidiobolus nylandii]